MKRAFDILGSSIALAFFILPMMIIAVLVYFKLGSPIIFVQERPGLNGNLFKMLKFRSMTDKRDSSGKLLDSSARLTVFGKVLRSTSLDELPGLINVLKGEMSLVGPRPLLSEYLPLYSVKQSRRHEVKPGITGWAQVNGRNNLNWSQKFDLDVWYVDNQSISLDLKILILTVKKVLIRDGINASDGKIVKPFAGNNSAGDQ